MATVLRNKSNDRNSMPVFALSTGGFSAGLCSSTASFGFGNGSCCADKRDRDLDGRPSSLRLSVDRPISPARSVCVKNRGSRDSKGSKAMPVTANHQKRTCLCSPTTHPGSFRCSLHKNQSNRSPGLSYGANRGLSVQRSAMNNSMVRICGVEGDLVKRALSGLIRPSSHQQRRRASFERRPSRLSVMSNS